jgi:hypothetical protein
MPFRSSRRRTCSAAAFLLAVALLFAQWSGLVHRVEHARLLNEVAHGTVSLSESSSKLHHSCLAFDAAAMADSIHAPPFDALPATAARVPALSAAFRSWDAPPVRHFSSRAPPMV